MWVPRCIIAAISMLVLTATPAVVEGTCHCADVCPNYDWELLYILDPSSADHICWLNNKHCDNNEMAKKNPKCAGYCVCNTFGCNCDGCEQVAGGCDVGQRMFDDKENEDVCTDFRYITSLSPEDKRDLLAKKYCLEDDKVAVQNIFEILRNEVLRKFGGSVLTCALFNESYVDVRHLKLCEDKQQHVVVSLLTTSSSTGNTNGGHSFVLVVVGLLGAAMMAVKVVTSRHGVAFRRNQYSEVYATTPIQA